MGRYAEPLIHARRLPAIENHVEVFIAEARLAHRSSADPDDVEEEQLMTVLVSFDPLPAQRWAARSLAGTFITAQSTFEQLPVGRDLAGWLIGLLNSRVAASVCLVWALPHTYSEETAHQVETVITGLRNSQHHLQLAIAVSVKPAEWVHCLSMDGFVATTSERNDRTALEVFNMLAALMAPGMSACFDAEDLRVVFGTHEFPSRVASGIWLEGKNLFILASDQDHQLLKNSRAIAFMPARPLRISSLHELLQALREFAASDSELVIIAPYGMSSEPFLADQIVPIFLVAYSVATQPSD